MALSIKYFGKLTLDQQKKILEQIETDNSHIPQFADKFRTMALFTVKEDMKQRSVDIFNFNSRGRNMAVGFKILVRNERFFAEPWVWVVTDIDKNVGKEITTLEPECLYFGTFMPNTLFQTYGSNAYNVMLGNLRLLQQHSMRRISL